MARLTTQIDATVAKQGSHQPHTSKSTLETYRNKRDFRRTIEPRGSSKKRLIHARNSSTQSGIYVIQKHAASHLHYDFRLELDGVLLSWAVPKGPSLDPSVKRLAMETEPHPIEYGGFEGTIPQGQYGGGAVMVWDRGHWSSIGDARRSYQKGHLSFTLEGEKLRGRWHLVRSLHGEKDNRGWLLFKSRDEFSKPGEDTILVEAPNSALSGRTLNQIASDAPEPSPKPAVRIKRESVGVSRSKRAKMPSIEQLRALPGSHRKRLVATVEPQLATLTEAAPVGGGWLHEIKFDGYRLFARLANGKVTLLSRNGKNWTERLHTLAQSFVKLRVDTALFDGEVVVLDEQGISNFQTLQNSLTLEHDQSLIYYAFDLLHLNGFDLTHVPLSKRKVLLANLLSAQVSSSTGALRLSEYVVNDGPSFFEKACKMGLEGIVSKRLDAPYKPGRTRDWLKIKCSLRQEFVIVGYTNPGGKRSHLGALVLALRRGSALVYCGRVGTGFSNQSLAELAKQLAPLEVSSPPLSNPPTGAEAKGVHWVAPELVAEVSFTGFTDDGLLRHPAFQGLREDNASTDVKLESAGAYPLKHPDKILYPESGISKRQLLDYYALVAERMLPHVANRPLTLVRCPNGWNKACFFQKHLGAGVSEGLRTVSIRESQGNAPYSVLDDQTGLFALVQIGVLEIHTWGSAADDLEHPNLIVFDLDPDSGLEFKTVIDCALKLRTLFESVKLQSFVKTTGGKGLHVCIPVEPDLDWDQMKDFSQRIAQELVRANPEKYVAVQSKARRKGKVFIDYLRNARGATFVAPYSTRARENAPIAVPLEWDELNSRIQPNQFTLCNIEERLVKLRQDPFARMLTVKQRLRSSA